MFRIKNVILPYIKLLSKYSECALPFQRTAVFRVALKWVESLSQWMIKADGEI